MTIWLCAERDKQHDQTEHAPEGEAMDRADELARRGVIAVVWPVEVEE